MVQRIRPLRINGLVENIKDIASSKRRSKGTAPNKTLDSLEYFETRNGETHIASPFAQEIAQYLKHITVNPNNLFSSDLIRNSYVFSQKGSNFVNSSKQEALDFVNALIDTAKSERDISLTRDEMRRTAAVNNTCVHVLKGDRGSGKTYFLNYLLVEHHKHLNNQKIVWVRLNFVYSSIYEDNIIEWMLAQAAKVLLRYYDKKSEYNGFHNLNILEHLYSWCATLDEGFTDVERAEMRRNVHQMARTFGIIGNDQPINPALCNRLICQEIFLYLRKEGWSFIFILDGFDQLDISPEHIAKFENIKRQIQSFISMRANFGAAILVVSRTNTFDYIRSFDPFKAIPPSQQFQLADANFQEVVSKRFDSIESVFVDQLPPHRENETLAFRNLIDGYRKKLISDPDFFSTESGVVVSNLRARMQLLYLKFLEFVAEETGKAYIVLEHMMLNGHEYPVVSYDYQVDVDQKFRLLPTAEASHESRFLPILTRSALQLWDGDSNCPSVLCSFLVKVRCIQVIMAGYSIKDNFDLPSILEVCNVLFSIFGYPRSVTLACIMELSAFDVVRINPLAPLPVNSDLSKVSPLPKAAYLLNECLNDVAYLNMCAMRSTFPSEVFEKRIVLPISLGSKSTALSDWVFIKLVNGTALFGALVYFSELEYLEAPKAVKELSDRERKLYEAAVSVNIWNKIFDMGNDFSKKLVRAIDAALDHRVLSFDEFSQLVERIEDVLAINWGRYVP